MRVFLMVILGVVLAMGQANAETPGTQEKIVSRVAGPRPEVSPIAERPPESLCPKTKGDEKIACLARLLVAVNKAADDAAGQNAADINWIITWANKLELELAALANSNPAVAELSDKVIALNQRLDEMEADIKEMNNWLPRLHMGLEGVVVIGPYSPSLLVEVELEFGWFEDDVRLRLGIGTGTETSDPSAGFIFRGDIAVRILASPLYLYGGGQHVASTGPNTLRNSDWVLNQGTVGLRLHASWFTAAVGGAAGQCSVREDPGKEFCPALVLSFGGRFF